MKKMTAFLLAFMMLMGVLFIFVSAEEATNQEGASCSCGGSYGAWEARATEIRQIRYTRKCDCGKTQTAKDITPKTISYTMPAIGANTGDTVFLSLYSVYFDNKTLVSADKITWSLNKVEIVDKQVCFDTAGVYELTATSGTSTKSVYLIVKNPTDTEYVLFSDDFNRAELGSDYTIAEAPSKTEYYLKDGKLVIDAVVSAKNTNQMRILLPEWLGVFGDYKIDTVFTMNSVIEDQYAGSYWFAVMARVDVNANYKYYPFWQAAVRRDAMSYKSSGKVSGVEIANKTVSGGSWSVPYKNSYIENLDPNTAYTLSFNIVGNTASYLLDKPNVVDEKELVFDSMNVNYLQHNTTKKYTYTGRIGFHLKAAKVSVDSIKIVVPIEDAAHNFTEWTPVTVATCLDDGLDRRECTICGTVEERVIKGEHKLVQHSAKLPTCTENGYKSYEECSACDHTTFNGYIPAFGHCYDREFHSIAHRGASSVAPENTLPAYEAAHKLGFIYVECDVMYTKDGYAVLNHEKLNGVSNATGLVSNYTYAELLELDFGSWKGEEFAGTKIATFEEFIACCARLGLHPYIELKNNGGITQDRVNSLVATVEEYGLIDNCSWISFSHTYLGYVKNADPTARLGYLYSNANFAKGNVNTAINLRNGQNEVFLDLSHTLLTDSKYYDVLLYAMEKNMPIAAWTIDDLQTLNKLPKYVSGVASNSLYVDDYFFTTAVTDPTCVAQGYTTYTCACGATKVADYVPATGNHTAKDGVCTECNAIVYCSDASHNLEIISISYAYGYDKDGVKVVRCVDCDAKNTETVANPLLACLGYSTPQDGRAGVAVSFKVDNLALNEYEAVTKKSISYGAFAVSQDNIKSNEIFDENGSLQNGVILADIANYKFNLFDIVIVGFDDDHMNSLFAMGAYVAVTENDKTEYSYIQNEAPLENAVYSFESYNSILSKMEGVE